MAQIAVIGASAAGLFAASRLASSRQVTVLERGPNLTGIERTLIVTSSFRDLLGEAAADAIVNRISRFELFADGKVAEVELGRPDLIIERRRLIAALADRATAAGVDLQFGRRVKGLEPSSDGVRIRVGPDETDSFRAVVGADGARSCVARAAGWPPVKTVPLLQAIVEMPEGMNPDTARVWFRPEETPYFYWLIPDGDGRGALGVIGTNASEIRERLDLFIDEQSLKAQEYQAAVIPAYERWVPARKRIGGGDVYLVGDAAAHVKVSTVGGIVTGFRGAAAVADAILHGHKRELRSLRRELGVHLLIRRALNSFTENDYRYLIGGMTAGTEASLRQTDRDHAARVLLSFVRAKPGVVLRAFRALLVSSRR